MIRFVDSLCVFDICCTHIDTHKYLFVEFLTPSDTDTHMCIHMYLCWNVCACVFMFLEWIYIIHSFGINKHIAKECIWCCVLINHIEETHPRNFRHTYTWSHTHTPYIQRPTESEIISFCREKKYHSLLFLLVLW